MAAYFKSLLLITFCMLIYLYIFVCYYIFLEYSYLCYLIPVRALQSDSVLFSLLSLNIELIQYLSPEITEPICIRGNAFNII